MRIARNSPPRCRVQRMRSAPKMMNLPKSMSRQTSRQSISELAASVEEASRKLDEEEATSSRSKLPIFAAVAASVACLAVLGVQSWQSATASTPVPAHSNGFAISDASESTPQISVGGFTAQQNEGFETIAATSPEPMPILQQPELSGVSVEAPSQAGGIAGFGTASEETLLAMAPPTASHDAAPVTMIDPPVLELPVKEVKAPPKAEFVPWKSASSKPSDSTVSLSRTDCAARFATVSRSDTINFESGSAKLVQSSYPILNFFATAFEHCQEFTIAVSGHTDSTGNANYNQALSQKRAASVARYLVEAGVPNESLRVIGYGESRPIASNNTALKRSRNRRIEFSIYDG